MTEPTDYELLADYARTGNEAAFAQLVARHINLVHSAARRFTGNDPQAEEITQAVFLILARKAGSLGKNSILTGWLYQTARLTAANLLKAETRRQMREQEAYMQSQENESDAAVWRQIAPLLDDAMGRLNATDRTVLLLRFFERQTNAEVAAALGTAEGAVQKRALRALEKLRTAFAKQGVTHTAQAIAGTVLVNSVQAAPTALVTKVSVIAAKGAATTTAITTLVKGTLKIMAWTKMKTAILVGMGVLLMAGTAEVSVRYFKANDSWRNLNNFSSRAAMQAVLEKTPSQVTILPTIYSDYGAMWWPDKIGRRLGMSSDITNLLMHSYGVRNTHMVFSEQMPGGKYDFIANLPQGSGAALQKKIKEQFGVVAHKAVIVTDVWVLKAGSQDNLITALSMSKSPHQELKSVDGKTVAVLEDESVDTLADALEGWLLQAPVFNRTGLSGRYDLSLNWDYKDQQHRVAKLIDQLQQAGFELSSSRERIEMLVVEKVK